MKGGPVYLVGAGPGDPDYLTLKAVRLLGEADAVLYDRLVHPSVLNYARRARLVQSVGKGRNGQGYRQEAIHRLLVKLCQEGYGPIVRLKGGDPFLFGRGGEEALALEAAGIPWEVVPGVSAALAAPALGHIPVTFRGVSRGVVIVSGTQAGGAAPSLAEWAHSDYTLVILMGVEHLDQLVAQLLAAGRPAETPAAVVSGASWPGARSVRASLSELPEACRRVGIEAPATIVVGPVTQLLPAPEALSGLPALVDLLPPG
ncbi:MAG: uroporphyrinogen-III C-methyltransferase [Firmicutes bacterium]|nr:uroporphyrinogen-III C-methyltransferase [Bacillota bacterium]